jgi:2-oxoglutarate ferredoxin oxidoreductase subunit alpha
MIVYAPASIQEIVDCVSAVFDVAEKYRTPVMLLVDGIIGQMMEPVELPEMTEYKTDTAKKPYAATGYDHNDPNGTRHVVNSLYIETHELTELNDRLQARYREIEKNEVKFEEYNLENANVLVCAYGTVARICKQAIDELKEEGVNAGLIRPITVWPFPKSAIFETAGKSEIKAVLTVELSAGQLAEDVMLAVNGLKPVEYLGHAGSKLPALDEIKECIKHLGGN